MQLYLVQNDPLDTLLVSADGEPLYSIHTSASTSSADVSPLLYAPDSSSSPSSFGFQDVSDMTSASSVSSQDSSSSSSKQTRPPLARHFAGFPEMTPLQRQQQKHRQPPVNVHPSIPISRTHSNPHPHDHGQYPDPSSPQPSPAIPHKIPSAHVLRPESVSPSAGTSSLSSPVTLVKRLERYNFSRGNVETELGKIDYPCEDAGIRVLLCNTGVELRAPTVPNRTRKTHPHPPSTTAEPESRSLSRRNDTGTALDAFRDFCLESQKRKADTLRCSPVPDEEFSDNEEEFIPDPCVKNPLISTKASFLNLTEPYLFIFSLRTWTLNDPADRPFKWLSLASCPVLVHDTQPTPTPVARYRPPKLGIVSRSCRGFLEILPAGLDIEDWIVVTFVAYFRMKLGEDACRNRVRPTYSGYHDNQDPSLISTMVVDRGGQTAGASLSAPATPLIRPQHYSGPRPPLPVLPLAYLGALRRKGKHLDAPQPRW